MQKIALILILIFGLNASAWAQFQDMAEIYPLITSQLKQELSQDYKDIEINIRELPDSLQLPKCQQQLLLETNLNAGFQARQSVLVSCPQPSWRIFVSTKIKAKAYLVVSTNSIQRHAVINPTDVALKLVPAQQARRNSFDNLENVIGMRARRMIRSDTPISPQMLATAYWVHKDQEITLISETNGLEITATGIALENGQQQDIIAVKNKNTNIELKGTVIAPNKVKVH